MPDDDDDGDDPFRTENRSRPDADSKARTDDIFREGRGQESIEDREPPPERPPDRDDD